VPSGVWIPREGRESDTDQLTLRAALLESNNAAAVLLLQRIGTRPVLQLARDLGVENQPDVPSLALGTGLVSPLELTTAYAVFPNQGYRVRPRAILKVVNAAGQTVHDTHIEREPILAEDVAFQMVTMLQDVTQRGTGASVRQMGVRGAIGGKTGSTNDYRDAWFVGFNASVVAGVWAGFDQPHKIRENGSGARVALPIWGEFMRRTAQSLPARPFVPPPGLRGEEICLISYKRPLDGCPTYVEYFKDGDIVPAQLCPIHEGSFKQEAQRAVRDLFGALGRRIGGIFR